MCNVDKHQGVLASLAGSSPAKLQARLEYTDPGEPVKLEVEQHADKPSSGWYLPGDPFLRSRGRTLAGRAVPVKTQTLDFAKAHMNLIFTSKNRYDLKVGYKTLSGLATTTQSTIGELVAAAQSPGLSR